MVAVVALLVFSVISFVVKRYNPWQTRMADDLWEATGWAFLAAATMAAGGMLGQEVAPETAPETTVKTYHAQAEVSIMTALDPWVDPEKDMTLGDLQKKLPWSNSYSWTFQDSGVYYKDFQHALTHVYKAAGKLAEAIEEADHAEHRFPPEVVDKYLADLVICTARMASTCPGRIIDLQAIVENRFVEKNGVFRPGRHT